jgi:ribulose 1,5-bisphosphate carboxylase large subunit-like protein
MDRWISLGREAARIGGHRTAFSPNFSHTEPAVVDTVAEWHAAISEVGPCVVKIDGGLDGLSAVQSVRLADFGTSPPIVTCYPLLRTYLASAVGPGGWVELLALSGVDIVYPGGRPSFADEARPIWAEEQSDWRRAARQYDKLLAKGWPMPTVAGGVHPGQLHAHFELLGPKVAYFLGGAVVLHPRGPAAGARLCVDVLRKAVQLAGDAARNDRDHAADLDPRLLARVENTRYPSTELNYFSPSGIFAPSKDNPTPPRPFYRR